ncbi:MurR/RpiR family transcriptional regulator [Pseudolysinimonas sp.]
MLITDLARNAGETLTPTDRRLVTVLQSNPAEAAYWRAHELTAPLALHESAATRLARRLGFDGYPGLRDALRDDYLAGDGPSQRIRGRLDRTPDDVLGAVVDDELAALAETPRHVAQTQLDALAARVLEARDIHLFGQGNATVLVDLLARRLQRFGLRTTALTGSRRDIAERAARLGAQDLLIAYAFRRVPSDLPPLLRVAADAGTHTALITDHLIWPSPRPDTLIAAPRGGDGDYLSLTVPMAITNAMVLTIARAAEPTTVAALDRLGEVLERFDL